MLLHVCTRRYYLHLHNEQSTQYSFSQEHSPSVSLLSLSISLSVYLLLSVDVSRRVSRVRLWEPIQPRFVNERRMNETPRSSGAYRLLNLRFQRNARRNGGEKYLLVKRVTIYTLL